MSDYILEEHLRQILRSLPVKSLLRFRCVSKGWKQLIDSPSFLQEHLSLQNPTFLIESPRKYLVADPDALPSIETLNSSINLPYYSLVGTHNGVVCLSDYPGPNIMLWNPTVRKFSTPIQVPCVVGYRSRSGSKGCYGFWIDPFTKEFKILVHHCYLADVDHSVCVLYSSTQQEWRFICQPELRDLMKIISEPPVMVNGVAHWTGFHRHFCGTFCILSFNFALERFEHIQMPPATSHMVFIQQFVWQGNLSLLLNDTAGFRYEIYARKQAEWVNVFGFNLPFPHSYQLRHGIHSVFWVLVREERSCALVQVGSDLLLLETTTGDTTHLVDDFTKARVANGYVQSLLFP